jgi:hypothetical protein
MAEGDQPSNLTSDNKVPPTHAIATRSKTSPATGTSGPLRTFSLINKEDAMRGLVLWFLGVLISVIVLLNLFNVV